TSFASFSRLPDRFPFFPLPAAVSIGVILRLATGRSPMNDSDLTVLAFLAHDAGFSDSQVRHLRDWWRACRNGDEELAGFLQRQQLVSEPTAQIFRQVGSHSLSFVTGGTLVDRSELETMRQRL